ncbi:MAG: RNA methyltransferase [Planctomycetota bacterium]|jgi:tRNA(Leu) C34 or U34 (ribose-2'-O)-methylase TrmL|nr:RNA methyltransferase [Planctomycetota bacterium]
MTKPEAPRRLRRAEAVLRQRSGRILLVLERHTDLHNQMAVLRTAEAMGLVYVWLVDDAVQDQLPLLKKSVTKGAHGWLEIRTFEDTAECIEALRDEGWSIWATDLSAEAVVASNVNLAPLPEKVAIVMGRESDGVSEEMLQAADKRIFLPMYGFTESFNLSVATGMLLQRLFDICPEAHGNLTADQRNTIRASWYSKLGGTGWESEYAQWLESPPEPAETLRPDPELRRPRMPKKLAKKLGIDPKTL